MSSTFNGQSLFNSGPHRFHLTGVGRSVETFPPPAIDYGVRQIVIVQTGRLIATSESNLRQQINAIQAVAESTNAGTLVDHHGQTWTNMRLYSFAPAGPPDRGRTISQRYEARYIRF